MENQKKNLPQSTRNDDEALQKLAEKKNAKLQTGALHQQRRSR